MPNNCINILNLYHDSKIDYHIFYEKIINKIRVIIKDTIDNITDLRIKSIFSENDFNVSMKILNDIYEKSLTIIDQIENKEYNIELDCQNIVDKLFVIICSFGTKNINDVFFLCNFIAIYENEIIKDKFKIIENYMTIIGVKKTNVKMKKTNSNIINDKINNDDVDNNLECFDNDTSEDKFFQKINGINVTFINKNIKITVKGILSNNEYKFLNNKYINNRISELKKCFTNNEFSLNIIKYASLKDILLYSTEDFKKRYIGLLSEVNSIKKK